MRIPLNRLIYATFPVLAGLFVIGFVVCGFIWPIATAIAAFLAWAAFLIVVISAGVYVTVVERWRESEDMK